MDPIEQLWQYLKFKIGDKNVSDLKDNFLQTFKK